MRRLALSVILALAACAPPPAPETTPEPAPAEAPAPREEPVIGRVRVTASALNVRASASAEADVVAQVKKGQSLSVLREDESWTKVKLEDGATGWVASRFVTSGAAKAGGSKTKKKGGCPADSDYAFLETPMLAFSDSGAHGMVVVEASVNANGTVTATKLVSNTTGDEALAFLAEREIKSAKFSPPIRNCVTRSFIFTYRRTF